MRIIAVTGATGFVGAHVLDRLRAVCPDAAIRALARRQQPDRPGVTWTPGALDDPAALDDLVRDAGVVIHLAGAVKARTASGFYTVNGRGTASLLAAMARTAPEAGLIHVSSLAARQPALSPYAGSKAAADEMVSGLGQDRQWTILRPPGVYGPGDGEILKLLRVAQRGILPAPGHIGNRVSLIHARDLAELLARLAVHGICHRMVLEVDDGQAGGYDYADLARILAQVLQRPVRPLKVPYPLLSAGGKLNGLASRLIGRTPMTAGKARELCHPDWAAHSGQAVLTDIWTPQIDLAAGLRETLDAARRAGHL